MRELISTIEGALGPERLARLRADDDVYQQFWLGVLEALGRADLSREQVGFLISNGYGAVRNMRRAENSRSRYRSCPNCGHTLGNRTVRCPDCGEATVGAARLSSTTTAEGAVLDLPDSSYPVEGPVDLRLDVESFLKTLSGTDLYVGRRWLRDRADLLYKNHLAQIAFELGVSKPRVAQVKARVREAFRRWYWGT